MNLQHCKLNAYSSSMLVHGVGNDICKDAKRQIISIEDVFTALEDLEFTELLPALKESLEGKPLYHCLLV